MNVKELTSRWRKQAEIARRRCALQRSCALEECAKDLEAQLPSDLMCPTPDVKGFIPVVMYFPDQASADELIEAFKTAKPNAIAKPL